MLPVMNAVPDACVWNRTTSHFLSREVSPRSMRVAAEVIKMRNENSIGVPAAGSLERREAVRVYSTDAYCGAKLL